jgi:replication factor C subunit 3/5
MEVMNITQINNSHYLPWIEKYRPDSLDNLVSHQDIISTISRFIAERRLPHLLFYGPPGTGKTSTIIACAKQLYGHKHWRNMVLDVRYCLLIQNILT